MPLYEYSCVKCGRVSEEYRSLDDRNLIAACPTCNGTAERIMSQPAQAIFAAGIYPSSLKDHAAKQKARLLKRSADHDRTKGKDEIRHTTERAMRKFHGG